MVVSANTKSQFYTNNISPATAAAHIVDGRGYARNNSTGGRPGGLALDYFVNQIKGFRDRKIVHPKFENIAEEVYKMGAFYAEASKAISDDGKKDNVSVIDRLFSSVEIDNGEKVSNFRSKYFPKNSIC